MRVFSGEMSITIRGTVGSRQVLTSLVDKNFSICAGSNELVASSTLWVVCFQRVSKRLKTCDVIWIDGRRCTVQTIDTSSVETIRDAVQCPVYDVGMDPLPWNRFAKDAQKYGWELDDWQHLLEEDDTDVEPCSEDSDYVPPDDESDESDEEDY